MSISGPGRSQDPALSRMSDLDAFWPRKWTGIHHPNPKLKLTHCRSDEPSETTPILCRRRLAAFLSGARFRR